MTQTSYIAYKHTPTKISFVSIWCFITFAAVKWPHSSVEYLPDWYRSGGERQIPVLKVMYYVYVIKSITFDRFYTGMTNDVDRRLAEHNAGRTKSTKRYVPYELVYFEEVENRIVAREREKYLKSSAGRRFLEKINIRPRSSVE